MANNLNDIKNSIDVPIITSDPNEININDYNVELDDDLMSIINDLTKKINI